ncbi:MAG: triose-phosphate isomerase [Candidatus Moranbacteria bacterium RIFOXYA12_FULL_44_15]|nr:MAG: triose-phosphate isomerase [Candidatus Moranbacteria bacterium RIFOXYA12_FULL_44_15]OGI34223.1 MAG: triose-phosphate isomerase [Candidatus Moranbacteria bacterium RIFOXYA2_FULL_43_15]
MPLKLVVGNLKMNILSPMERERYFDLLKKELKGKRLGKIEIILCPPHIHLESFFKVLGKKIKIGALNMFWEREGSFTGEISPAMIKNFGGEYVIIGHSERRRYFCENDQEINLKMEAALKNGLKPILCVGDREQKPNSAAVIIGQLKNCLDKVTAARLENVIICYEPVWAISSNNPDHLPTTNDVMSARLIIKKFLVEKYGARTADKVRIIYGGSVNSKNAKKVCLEPGMDGVLVGRESLAPYEFVKIAEIING